jgi:serine phosphatase RsbU (regulator of sigma subunit)/anti-anti-sigma regulatory factor
MTGEYAASDASEPGQGPVFLVVDDDPMVRKIVTRGLSQLNPSEVLEVEDGLVAQSVLREKHIDVVVTDVVMPNMDGLELMKWAQEHCPEPLWIILSGLETFDAAVDALQLGAFDYLAKPPEVPRVRVAVRNALDQIELVRERKRLYKELESSNTQLAEKVEQLQKVCRVLEDQAAVIQADLDRAEIIQRALLPQEPPRIPGWCIETLYRPGSSVGGDFYDAVVIDNQHLGLVIADAAGHGVAAAMLSVLFKLRLKQVDSLGQLLKPEKVLQRLNDRLFDMLSAPGAFITAVYMLVDLRTGRARLSSAGHPPCIFRSPDGAARMLERTGPALGLEANASYGEHTFQLAPRDRLMLYTDGVIEGGPHSPGADDIASAMGGDTGRMELLGQFFQDAVREVSGDRDDITLLLLERGEGVSHFDDAPGPADRHHTGPAEAPPQLLHGVHEQHAFIAIAGSITWLVGQPLHDCAKRLLESYPRLTIDLENCEHMDSTCLGTIHEIVTANPDEVDLQSVSGEVRKLFEELSMTAVMNHISPVASPLPRPMATISANDLSPQQQGARILSAHETLASLSADNEEQFRTVVDSLRVDLDGDD